VQDGDVNIYGCPGHFSIFKRFTKYGKSCRAAKCFVMLSHYWRYN